MISLRQPTGFRQHFKQLLCITLSIGVVMIGFPANIAMAGTSAAGQPYVNCATMAADIDRLESLKSGMQRGIDQQANLASRASSDSRNARDKADAAAQDQIVNTLKEVGSSYFTLLKRAKALKMAGLSQPQRRRFEESLNALKSHKDLFESFNKGLAYGDPKLGSSVKDASDAIYRFWQTIEQSGVAEEIAKEGAGLVFGPLGKTVVGVALASLETLIASQEANIEADVARTAQRHLEVMEGVQGKYTSQIYRLSELNAGYCVAKSPGPEDRMLVSQPSADPAPEPEAPAPEASSPTPAAKSGMGAGAKAAIIGITAIGVGSAVGMAIGNLDPTGVSGSSSGACSTRDFNPISQYTGSLNTTSLCSALPITGSGGACRINASGEKIAWCPVGLTCCTNAVCGSC